MLIRVIRLIEWAINAFGLVVMWGLLPPLIVMRAYDIVARQFYNTPSRLFQYLEWNAFFLFVLLTIAFTYLRNGHVRIDILRDRASPRAKAWIEILGYVFALLPFCVLIVGSGSEYAWTSYERGERWLFGLDLWIKKAAVPFAAFLLLLVGLLITVRNVLFLLGRQPAPAPDDP